MQVGYYELDLAKAAERFVMQASGAVGREGGKGFGGVVGQKVGVQLEPRPCKQVYVRVCVEGALCGCKRFLLPNLHALTRAGAGWGLGTIISASRA